MAERADPVFIERAYAETLALMVEARDYFTHDNPARRRGMSREDGLRASCEALRVTSRLTQVMAWLMMQRALRAGEVTEDEAFPQGDALDRWEVCLDEWDGDDGALPPGLRSLLARSRALYQRIARLDDLARGRMH